MRNTLTFKLALAFLLVSLAVTILAAGVARWITVSEFNRLILEQAQNRFVAEMTTYYQIRGGWEGVMEYLRQRPAASQGRPNNAGIRPLFQKPANANESSTAISQSVVFVLTDRDGLVVIPAGTHRIGDHLSQSTLLQAATIEVNGQVVGYALATGDLPPLDTREQRYLARTDQALLYTALGAAIFALLLGVFMARTLTRPVRQMTSAIRAMAGGELEQRVAVQTQDELGELAAAFNQMSAALAHSNQQRRQMTADIAHDLRTPLTVIAGYVEAMQDGVLPSSEARFEAIHSEVQHLLHLVEDLRTLSLADAGELRLNRQFIAPGALLDRLAAAYQPLAAQQGISLQTQVLPDLSQINMDEERMAQVLGNLISNALRHTPGGGQIVLAAGQQAGKVYLKVQDTGEGIPPEALPRVFDRFYRVDSSRSQQGGASGLGLAIARSIVEVHGGRITVESQAGKGTIFTIVL